MDSSFLMQSRDTESTLDTISAMKRQESTGYSRGDCFKRHLSSVPFDIDTDCRKKMSSWQMQVVDFCRFNRESVEISSQLLDRYLMSNQGIKALKNRSMFQLAAMTCLYTAVKIHEPEAMDPKLVSNLSRGTYTPRDIEQMELELVKTLEWHLNPPTALAFVRLYFNLIPDEAMDQRTRRMAYDVAKFQTELAVLEFDFVSIAPSVTAFCSFINALESLDLDRGKIDFMSAILREATGIESIPSGQVLDVQSYLYGAVLRHQPVKPPPKPPLPTQTVSPKSVAIRNRSFTSVLSPHRTFIDEPTV